MSIQETLKILRHMISKIGQAAPGLAGPSLISNLAGALSFERGMQTLPLLAVGKLIGILLSLHLAGVLLSAGEVILVKWEGGPESEAAAEGNALIGSKVKRNFRNIGWQSVSLPDGMSTGEGMARYLVLPGVVGAEIPRSTPLPFKSRPDSGATDLETLSAPLATASSGANLPNDPRFNSQWNLRQIGATNAWSVTTGSSNVVVAILDSGVAYNHPDLRDNMWRNPGETGFDASGKDKSNNKIDDDENGYVDDVYGIDALDGDSDPNDLGGGFHGTRCAGIIGARGNNGVGLTGLNWQVQMMAVRIWGDGRSIDTDVELEGLEYVLEMKRRGVNIRVLSESAGGGPFDYKSAYDVHRALHEAGIVSSFIAMNEGRNNDSFSIGNGYFEYPNIIITAATGNGDAVASYSNYGRTSVDIFAPATDAPTTTSGTGYGSDSWGTSFAGPHVSGAAALLAAAQPDATALEIKAALLHSVDQKPAFTNRVATHGRLNVGRAMQMLRAEGLAPIVLHSSPSTSRTRRDAIFEVWFSQPMDRQSTEAAFQVSPPVEGTFEWVNESRLRFSPSQPLVRTNHTARILGSAMSSSRLLDGNFNRLTEGAGVDDFIWTFGFAPDNDLFEDALAIGGIESSVTNTTLNATWEDDEPEDSAWDGENKIWFASLWYRWTAPQDGWVTFETSSFLDTVLAAYSGLALSNLTRIAGNDNDGTRRTSRLSFEARQGASYSITALTASPSSVFESMGKLTLMWRPTPAPTFAPMQFSPTGAPPGSEIVLFGTNFIGATGVMFNGSPAQFRVQTNFNLADRQLLATVPAAAASGPITVLTPRGNVTSSASFQPLPPPLSLRFDQSGRAELAWGATSDLFVAEYSPDLVQWQAIEEYSAEISADRTRLTLPHALRKIGFFRLKSKP